MSILRVPSLGPIVGHTTDKSCKLWIRAKDSNAFQVGVLKLMQINDKPPPKGMATLYYFCLDRERNRIGIFDLGKDVGLGKSKAKPLTPDTKYKVCLATLPTKIAKNNIHSEKDLRKSLPNLTAKNFDDLIKFPEKGKKSVAVFRTFPALNSTPAQSLTFLLGSCHHPLSDSIFVPMDQQVCDAGDADRPRFVLMVGDQIYADECGWFSGWLPDWLHFCERAETYEEFQERYRTAFGSRYMRQLLRHVPTYMILDDHEIEDNWSPEHGKGDLFDNAIEAYENYQWSHGPCTFNDDKDDDKKFYYTFDAAGYPFFVLDTRTKRAKKKKDITKNDMLGEEQLKCLLDWLMNMQDKRDNVPKFIVTSNVFVPNEKKERTGLDDAGLNNAKYWLSQSDSWPAFPTTRAAILEWIVRNQVQNVVFLSGDIHCSNVAKIKFTGSNRKSLMDRNNKPLKAFSITSSPFFSPISDGNDEAYVRNSAKEGDSFSFGKDKCFTMNYRSFFPFTANVNNFCRVKIDKKNQKIIICFFDDDGDAMDWADDKNTGKFPKSRYFYIEPWK